MSEIQNDQPPVMGLLWGAASVARALGRTERAVFHMLENSQLPGATKIGRRWCFDPATFRAALAAKAAALPAKREVA